MLSGSALLLHNRSPFIIQLGPLSRRHYVLRNLELVSNNIPIFFLKQTESKSSHEAIKKETIAVIITTVPTLDRHRQAFIR